MYIYIYLLLTSKTLFERKAALTRSRRVKCISIGKISNPKRISFTDSKS